MVHTVLNDAPYGFGKAYKTLRLVIKPSKIRLTPAVRVFLMAML